MAKPEFAMSMFVRKEDLYKAKAEYFENELKKLRDELVVACDSAAKPAAFMQPEEYDTEAGKEFAYADAVDRLNKVLGE